MPNLRWTDGLDHLDGFSFAETNVMDGDLSHLLELPRLQSIATESKRHYNYKEDDLNEILEKRSKQHQ